MQLHGISVNCSGGSSTRCATKEHQTMCCVLWPKEGRNREINGQIIGPVIVNLTRDAKLSRVISKDMEWSNQQYKWKAIINNNNNHTWAKEKLWAGGGGVGHHSLRKSGEDACSRFQCSKDCDTALILFLLQQETKSSIRTERSSNKEHHCLMKLNKNNCQIVHSCQSQ